MSRKFTKFISFGIITFSENLSFVQNRKFSTANIFFHDMTLFQTRNILPKWDFWIMNFINLHSFIFQHWNIVGNVKFFELQTLLSLNFYSNCESLSKLEFCQNFEILSKLQNFVKLHNFFIEMRKFIKSAEFCKNCKSLWRS
jgi:hypothetical protein